MSMPAATGGQPAAPQARASGTASGDAAAKRLLDELAREPRPAGSEAERAARDLCAARLAAAGFAVREELFDYSAFPGRYATALGGGCSGAALVVAALFGGRGSGAAALGVLVGALALLAVAGQWLLCRGVVDAPLLRRRGINLVATRGAPTLWLVAHLDSKSQPVPILMRAGGIVLSAILWVTALGVALAQARGAELGGAWPWLAGAGVLAALPVAASVVGVRSPGAVDNASGAAAVLLAAEAVPPDAEIGVLMPSAEELGLAGARAWARGRPPGVAVNCDGVDDRGMLTLMYSGGRPERLLAVAAGAAASSGQTVRARWLVPGILTDGVALADAGWEAVTVSRGTLGTLARVHRPGDRAECLDGGGIADAARLIAAMVGMLRGPAGG